MLHTLSLCENHQPTNKVAQADDFLGRHFGKLIASPLSHRTVMCTKQMKTNILFTFFLLLGLSISTSSVKGQNNCDSVWTSSRTDASKIDVTGTYELAYPLGQRLILHNDGTFKEELLFEYDTGSPIDSRIGTYSIRKDTLIAQFEGFILKNGATQSDLD